MSIEKVGLREVLGDMPLALSAKKQSAVLGHVFNPHSRLFAYLIAVAEKSWWSHPMHQVIWEFIQKFHATYGRCPTLEEVSESNAIAQREGGETERIRGMLANARQDASAFHVEPLRDEIQTWMQAKILQNAYAKGVHLWNKGKFDDSTETVKTAIKQLSSTSFLDTAERKLTDIKEIATDLGPAAVVPFGIKGVDNHLFPNNPQGSLRKGDQTVIMAPVNMGKSTTLITVAIHNVRADQDVLFVSHEGHRSDLRLKMIRCYMTLMDVQEFRKVFPNIDETSAQTYVEDIHRVAAMPLIDIVDFMLATPVDGPKGRLHKLFNKLLERLQSHLTFLPLHKPAMEVEEVMVHIERMQELWQETHQDEHGVPKGYDLFVCDYPGVLTTRQNKQGNMAWRHVQETVYNTFVQLALQHEWHSLVAIQTNRDGSRINSGTSKGGEHRFLTNEDVAECWGAIMSATTVLTVNRSPQAQTHGRVTFAITKSRSSTTGYAVTCYGNFAQGVSHANMLGSTSYYGTTEQQAVLDIHLKPGQNTELTQAQTIGAISQQTQGQT